MADPPAAQSFEVEATFSWAPFENGDIPAALFPNKTRFTMTLDRATPGRETVLIGGGGATAQAPVVIDGHGEIAYAAADPALLDALQTTLQFAFNPPFASGCAQVSRVSFTKMDLVIAGDRISGTASGFAGYSGGDYLGTRAFTSTLVGTRDVRGPAVTGAAGPRIAVDPFDGLAIDFDEALSNTVRARLDDGATSYPLDSRPAEFPSRFSSASLLLPFGRQLVLHIDPPLTDLAGNAGATPNLTAVTPELAGPFSGFEGAGPLRANLTGTARIVDGSVIPALSGKHGLLMDSGPFSEALSALPGGRFTARLPIPAGGSAIVLVVRALLVPDGGSPWLRVRSGTVGGVIDDWFVEYRLTATSTVPSGFSEYPLLGAETTFRHPIPPGITGELVLDLSSRVGRCGALLTPGASLIESIGIE